MEALTVAASVAQMPIRVTTAYGPQEYDSNEKKENFWLYLEQEVVKCTNEGYGCIIAMDSNSWLGKNHDENDPHDQNRNGKLFENFLQRNDNMNVLNFDRKCKGKITRSRTAKGRKEESIIDYILVNDLLLPYFKSMRIDEEKLDALTNLKNKKVGSKAVVSDHNSMFAEFDLKIKNEKTVRRTIYKFNDKEAMAKFKKHTTNFD